MIARRPAGPRTAAPAVPRADVRRSRRRGATEPSRRGVTQAAEPAASATRTDVNCMNPLMLTIMTPYGYYTTPAVRKNRADVGPPRKPDG